MKPAAALKIGQLVPIDALLSGTYTKLKSYIDVNARLIDVATGEITVSFNGRIKMTKNLATLFGENEGKGDETLVISLKNENKPETKPATTTKTKKEICKEHGQRIEPLVEDLTTDEKVNRAVSETMKFPFEYNCDAHLILTYALTRYKITNNTYKSFLIGGLDTMTYQYGDDRARMAVRYFAMDDNVDDKEWSTCLNAMKRLDALEARIMIENLVASPKTPGRDVMEKRIAQYFDLASAQQLGVPRRLTYDRAFFTMLDGLRKNQSLRFYVYKTYAKNLEGNDQSKKELFSALTSIYNDLKDQDVMKAIVEFANVNDYPKAAEQLYEFAFGLKQDPNLQLLTDGSRDKFSKYALQTEYQSQKEDRVEFCVIHNIPIPGTIPTMDEANSILKGDNAAEQLRVTTMLAMMGERPKPLENSLIELFSKRSLNEREKLAEAQMNAIIVLGNIRTSNQKAIEYMISVLPHYGNDTEAAMISLAQIGKPAVNALVTRLDKTTIQDGGLQYQLLTLLGKIGKPAAVAEKSITRVLNATSNSDVKYAAEAALQEIKK
ncbi:MAG: FlgO family outer membrane protein [Bacteroidota bacterium]